MNIGHIETVEEVEDIGKRLGAVVKYYNGKIHNITEKLDKSRIFCSLGTCCECIIKRNGYQSIVRDIEFDLATMKEFLEKGYYCNNKKPLT